jgi:hypothetical protein
LYFSFGRFFSNPNSHTTLSFSYPVDLHLGPFYQPPPYLPSIFFWLNFYFLAKLSNFFWLNLYILIYLYICMCVVKPLYLGKTFIFSWLTLYFVTIL